jgi:hypothetical protein
MPAKIAPKIDKAHTRKPITWPRKLLSMIALTCRFWLSTCWPCAWILAFVILFSIHHQRCDTFYKAISESLRFRIRIIKNHQNLFIYFLKFHHIKILHTEKATI